MLLLLMPVPRLGRSTGSAVAHRRYPRHVEARCFPYKPGSVAALCEPRPDWLAVLDLSEPRCGEAGLPLGA
jgi:hypothetical protein